MTRALREGSLLWQVHGTTAALGVVQPLAPSSGGGAVGSPPRHAGIPPQPRLSGSQTILPSF